MDVSAINLRYLIPVHIAVVGPGGTIHGPNTQEPISIELTRKLGEEFTNPGLSPTVMQMTIGYQTSDAEPVQDAQHPGSRSLTSTATASTITNVNQMTDPCRAGKHDPGAEGGIFSECVNDWNSSLSQSVRFDENPHEDDPPSSCTPTGEVDNLLVERQFAMRELFNTLHRDLRAVIEENGPRIEKAGSCPREIIRMKEQFRGLRVWSLSGIFRQVRIAEVEQIPEVLSRRWIPANARVLRSTTQPRSELARYATIEFFKELQRHIR
jgi:hypothetical protein